MGWTKLMTEWRKHQDQHRKREREKLNKSILKFWMKQIEPGDTTERLCSALQSLHDILTTTSAIGKLDRSW